MLIIVPNRVQYDDFSKSRLNSSLLIPRSKLTICTKSQLIKLYEIHAAFERQRRYLIESMQEVLGCIFLNRHRQLMGISTLSRGTSNSVDTPFYKLERDIINLSKDSIYGKVHFVAFFHNHPNGLALPSQEDIACTKYSDSRLMDTTGVQVIEDFIAGQMADMRFDDELIKRNVDKYEDGPIVTTLFKEMKSVWDKTHPEHYDLKNERGFYFLSKDGICPGVGLS